jgi:ribosomal protein L37AE/L43A
MKNNKVICNWCDTMHIEDMYNQVYECKECGSDKHLMEINDERQ